MIYLIRPGQTAMNQSKQFQDHMDTDLDMERIRQAKVLSAFFKTLKIREIHTSDLKKAVQTATAIQNETSAPIINDVRLREIDVGICERKSWADFQSGHAYIDRCQRISMRLNRYREVSHSVISKNDH